MWNEILIAIALMLVLEGLLPILSPKSFKKMMSDVAKMNESQLRWTGFISMFIGTAMIYWLKH